MLPSFDIFQSGNQGHFLFSQSIKACANRWRYKSPFPITPQHARITKQDRESHWRTQRINSFPGDTITLPTLSPVSIQINRINHYTVEGTRESHLSDHGLQYTTRLVMSWIFQIMGIRIGFPCSLRSVIMIYHFSPSPLFPETYPILITFIVQRAMSWNPCPYVLYGNVMPIALPRCHRSCLATPHCRQICLLPCILGIFLSQVGETINSLPYLLRVCRLP